MEGWSHINETFLVGSMNRRILLMVCDIKSLNAQNIYAWTYVPPECASNGRHVFAFGASIPV